eukprot:g4395.t1
MMLFLIGLELKPSLLWDMRRPILGLGGLQVSLSAIAITLALLLISDLEVKTSIAIGLALALSSTAIVIQTLSEKGLLRSQAGNNVFSVLLFQDIAVIPILAALPLLAISGGHSDEAHHGAHETTSLVAGLPMWAQVAVMLGAVAAIIAGGRFLATPIFRYIAETRLRELFTAFALLNVVAIAALMEMIGLSAALGTFLAGVVLAENEFRHELEADIEPFKGLLLGLFFITVGAGIDFNLLIEIPVFVIGCVIALIAIKATVLAFLARIFKLGLRAGTLFSVSLAQGGEFAFVLVAAGSTLAVFTTQVGNVINLVVALSMLISPLFFLSYEWYFSRLPVEKETMEEEEITPQGKVIIAGYGRFGQVVGRLLAAQNFKLTVMDHNPGQIELENELVASVMGGYEGHRGWINYLAVKPAEQGNGYGRRMMEAIEERIRAKGCPKINLQVRATNSEVIAFYEAIGYGNDNVVGLGKRLEQDC